MLKNAIILCLGFLIIVFPLFSDGMFMDGTIYAAIADNLAQGNGSLWHMEFSKTLMSDFHEHPPLAIWLESIFHYVFKGSMLSERFFSLTMWLLNAIVIVKLWEALKQPKEYAWFPLLLWVIIPEIHWAFSNNILENTMGVFVSCSVLFYLKSLDRSRWIFLFLYALMILCVFLSKGFTGCYVLILPMLIGLFWKKDLLLRTFIDSIVSVGIIATLFSLIWFGWEGASSNIMDYLVMQVAGSVENVATVSFRGQILLDFLNGLILPGVIIIALILIARRRKLEIMDKTQVKMSTVLILLCLAGVIPIMISMKQRSFYILTVYPFAVLALASIFKSILPLIDSWLTKHIFKKIVLYIAIPLSIISAGVSATFVGRDKEVISDVYTLVRMFDSGETVCVTPPLNSDWGVIAYLSRYGKISVKLEDENCFDLLRMKSDVQLPETENGFWTKLKYMEVYLQYRTSNPKQ